VESSILTSGFPHIFKNYFRYFLNQWGAHKIFMGGFYQWHMVVILFGVRSLWRHIHISKLMFWRSLLTYSNMHILLHALPSICVMALNINYQLSRLGYRRKINSTLRHSSHNCKNIRPRVKTASKTNSSLCQSNLQLRNQAGLMSRRIRAVSTESVLLGCLTHTPVCTLQDRILLNFTRIENAHKVRK